MAITQLFPDRYSSLENTVKNSYMPKPSKLVASAMLATQLFSASAASAEQVGELGLKIGRKVREVVSIGPTQKPTVKAQPAPQNDWVIDKANITIYDPQGKEIKTYLQQPEGATIPVPENGRVEITHPKYARNTKTGGTLALDVLIQNKNNHYETNARRMADRTERAFPLDFEAEDAKLLVWNGDKQIYKMYLVGERSNTTDSIEVSTKPYLLEVYKFQMPAAAPQQPAATPPVIVVVPVPMPQRPKHDGKIKENQKREDGNSTDKKSRLILGAELLTGRVSYAVTLDPQSNQFGGLARGVYDTPQFHFAGGVRFTTDSEYNPNQGKLSSNEFTLNADYAPVVFKWVAPVVSGELGRSQTRVNIEGPSTTTFAGRGFPESENLFTSAGGGLVLGDKTGSNIRVLYELVWDRQTGGYYLFPYGDIALSSRELNGSAFKIQAMYDGGDKPSVELLYSAPNLKDKVNSVDITSSNFTGRAYFPLFKDKKINLTIAGNIAKWDERGPGLHNAFFDRNYVAFGFAWKERK